MTDEFSARAARVEELLHSSETAFVLVTSAQDRPIEEAIWFRETLRESGMPFIGAIVNRVTQPLPPGEVALDLPPDLTLAVDACAADHRVLAERDVANIERLRDAFAGESILQVPDFTEDVHDSEGLLAIHRELFNE
jgi:anion-transporting  ArsA/GET3 family ATPase